MVGEEGWERNMNYNLYVYICTRLINSDWSLSDPQAQSCPPIGQKVPLPGHYEHLGFSHFYSSFAAMSASLSQERDRIFPVVLGRIID